MHDTVDFNDLCAFYAKVGSLASPAELHGQLCGYLVGGQKDLSTFVRLASEQMNLDASEINEEIKMFFEHFFKSVSYALYDSDFSFSLLLPDEEDISLRLESLAKWCQGFLLAYGLSGLSEDSLSKEAREILLDLSHIMDVDTKEEMDEQAEEHYMQVYEYVRIAILVLLDEQNAHDKKH